MDPAEQERLLIARVKAGETAAFRSLVERYQDDAFSLACSIVKDRQLAEDILQEVFLKVFDKIRTFKHQSAFYTWLYRIIVNRCYNELRNRKVISGKVTDAASDKEETSSRTDQNDLKGIINGALDLMKPDEALVLRLFYLSELNVEEVMEVTGYGKSKVKTTLHRGRQNLTYILKRQLGKEIEDL